MGDVVEKAEAAGQGSAFVEAEAEANRIAAASVPESLSVIRGSECVSLPVPERVLWLAAANQPVVVSVGEPAIFAAPGGSGKSYAALALMLAASGGQGTALGFGIRPGTALCVSYEDSPARIGARLNAMLEMASRKGTPVAT